ncbi:MAG: hypothetical protein ACRD4O_04020 [Bryobacteraceae bacterium]
MIRKEKQMPPRMAAWQPWRAAPRLLLRVSCMLLTLTPLLNASQVWNKNPTKWSKADARRILNASPWAQRVQVEFPKPDMLPRQMPLPGPAQAGMGTRGNGEGRDWDGGVEKNPKNLPGVPKLSVLVRWDSALPVREAMLKLDRPSVPDSDYIITVIGLVPAGSYEPESSLTPQPKTSESGDGADAGKARNPERMLDGLMADSMLATSSRIAIRPENVKLDAATGILRFFFPRKQTILLSDKEAIFETKFSSMKIKYRFRLKDMVYHGKLEL